jgi:hypothetical protein
MRERVLKDLTDTLYQLCSGYADPLPQLVNRTLTELAKLIDWIDIGFVLNERYTKPHHTSHRFIMAYEP